MRIPLLLPALCIVPFLASCLKSSESPPAPLPPLSAVTLPFRTVAFDDTEYSDLKGFRDMIGDSRIVMLGEQTHGEGSTFAAKARLTRFLHEKMGFDVFMLESGFFDMNRIWQRARAGEALSGMLKGSVFFMFEKSAEMRPLFDYMDARKSGPRPLVLTGMDSQHGGALARDSLMRVFRSFMTRHGFARVGTANWNWAQLQTNSFLNAFGQKLGDSALARYRAYNDTLMAEVRGFNARSDTLMEDGGFWENVLAGLRFQADKASDSSGNARDAQMAANAEWLMEHPYKGRKIVVWTHNVHAFRSFGSIYEKTPDKGLSHLKLMGAHLAETYGRGLFVLGVTSRQGGYVDWSDGATKAVPALDPDLVEMQVDAGLAYGFIDLRDPPPSERWLTDVQRTCLVDFFPYHARLPEIYDGLLYIKTATPTNGP